MADPARCGRPPVHRAGRTRRTAIVLLSVVGGVALNACSGSNDPEPTAADYLVDLEAICAATAARLDALPHPPEEITVTDFATQAGSILTDEAEQLRQVDVPADLDDDHRALIANDEDQAAGWSDLAAAASSGSAELSEITTTITSLILGRNDLVTELGAPGCVRSPE
jgi:hypothetical protein